MSWTSGAEGSGPRLGMRAGSVPERQLVRQAWRRGTREARCEDTGERGTDTWHKRKKKLPCKRCWKCRVTFQKGTRTQSPKCSLADSNLAVLLSTQLIGFLSVYADGLAHEIGDYGAFATLKCWHTAGWWTHRSAAVWLCCKGWLKLAGASACSTAPPSYSCFNSSKRGESCEMREKAAP